MSDPPIVWLTLEGPRTVDRQQVPSEIGAKAAGLIRLPPSWVPAFFVVSAELDALYRQTRADLQESLIAEWIPQFVEASALSGIPQESDVYLRSNAINERILDRGRFRSIPSSMNSLARNLRLFFEKASAVDPGAPIGLVVQRFVDSLIFGHLSNERRVAEEYRDAVIEQIDRASGTLTEEPISFRRWRRQKGASFEPLLCDRKEDISSVLREPLTFAATRNERILFEWAWDGRFIHVLQADTAPERQTGTSPEQHLQPPSDPEVFKNLKVFRLAVPQDSSISSKLRNHFRYDASGFKQPPIYVLRDQQIMASVLAGELPARLEEDLRTLTQRPLVIRTSTVEQGVTLLPRSDMLTTPGAAKQYLLGQFREEILRRKLDGTAIGLIAHHFIPAIASAFSAAGPNQRHVYIEALWGIPEGLYYYPCDAYLVDTLLPDADALSDLSIDGFAIDSERRYKGEFVAPDAQGKFVVSQTARPWDWKNVLTNEEAARIALFSRRLAREEQRTVKVMWFVGCAQWTGLPRLLPWYHDFEGGLLPQGDSVYTRNHRDTEISLRTLADLQSLERSGSTAKLDPERRVVICLNPIEDQIIRNESVAERIGKVAVALHAVVELQGGVLSHIYYALLRTGANIAVRNRPSFSSRASHFNKLVRDRIPEVVAAGGERATISRLNPEEFEVALKVKLVEEAFEARDATNEGLVGELADLLEVIAALAEARGISQGQLDDTRRKKREKRGGFDQALLLVETQLQPPSPTGAAMPSLLDNPYGSLVIETNRPRSLEGLSGGPSDVRVGGNFFEYVQSASVGLTQPDWSVSSPNRGRFDVGDPSRTIEWTLEGRREGSVLRLRLKVKVGTGQLNLPLDEEAGQRN